MTETPLTVKVRAVFESMDPSFYDSSIDLCEVVPFDVVVIKRDCPSALFIRAASVNSELRLRSWQLVAAEAMLKQCDWSEEARYNRAANVYQGPCFSELPRFLQQELMDYVTRCLCVDSQVVEYICQMTYFAEGEEYLAWLARMQHFTSPPPPQ